MGDGFIRRRKLSEAIPDYLLIKVRGFCLSFEYESLDHMSRAVPDVVCGALVSLLERLQRQAVRGVLVGDDVQTLDDIYAAIEELASLADSDVQNVVVTGLLENITEEKTIREAILRRLGHASCELLKEWID